MNKAKKLGRYFVPNAKILEEREGSTVFRVVGIPFGGPEWLGGKDLHGEYFDRKNTDLGKDENGEPVVKTIYAYYDHALNDSIGGERIGFAKFYEETDEGQVWDIEVMRAYRYHDMLLQLAQKGLLGASSQPVQTAVDIDWESGLIKRWHPVEISLTPTPANPNAKVVLKSFGVEIPDDSDNSAEGQPDQPEPVEESEVPESEDDLSAEIEQMFDADDEATEPIVPVDIAKMFSDLAAKIDERFAALETQIGEVKSQQEKANQDLMAVQQATKAALKTFASQVATRLKGVVQEIVDDERSGDEREADRIANKVRSVIPAGAPGTKTRKEK